MIDPDPRSRTSSRFARVGDVELCYETFGDPAKPPMLLIMGLAAQMVVWDVEFCEQLAQRGYFVIRFDNRDMGFSTRFDGAPAPTMIEIMTASYSGKPLPPVYTLRDCAADGVGLLAALGYESAHVVGLSMGGMIAQTTAIEFPAAVRTLTSIMSSTGDPSLPQATPPAVAVLTRPPQFEREPYIEGYVSAWAVLNGEQMPYDAEKTRATAALTFDRGLNPAGVSRQMLAIIASGNRTERLHALRVPTTVIHGSNDPLVPNEAGRATAAAIPGAELVIVEGMGHTLPRQAWPRVIDAIVTNAARVP